MPIQTPLSSAAYKIHFEALDVVQPHIADPVEEVAPTQNP